jgi:hypothetical protein
LIILENQSLPWEYEYKLWSDQYDSFILSLGAEKLTGDDSSIVLEIYSDDRILNYLIFYGAFEKETIAAKIYLYGDSWD